MADEVVAEEQLEAQEQERPGLDPEVKARRDAALKFVKQWGDPVLKSRALPVTRFDDELRQEVRMMGQLMDEALGVGLAATQLGNLRRLLVYRTVEDGPLGVLINPELEYKSKDEEVFDEGCLSLPGVLVEVSRPLHVRVRAQDEHGDRITVEASGFEARVIQHEMDHLDGVLILDRTKRDQRKEAVKHLRALADERDAAA